MTNLIKADFNGTQVLFQNNAYLNATTIAKAFGKQPKDYLRNERTGDYIKALINRLNSNRRNRLFEENQIVIKKGGSSTNGGGTWLHPKLAIDFARWLSAEFAVWCDEQIERILYPNVGQPKLGKTDSDDRTPLRQAVSQLVATKKMLYPEAYAMVHQRFGIEHIEELTHEQIPQAVEYVHTVLSGELMPKKTDNDNHINGLAILYKATRVRAIQEAKLQEALAKFNHAATLLDEAIRCCSAVSSGFSEAIPRLNSTAEERQQATIRADAMFESWKKRKHFMA